jgi:uncharacterized protein (DUF1800 family)
MELHTLGVDAAYTQADVMALARILTGWSVKERWLWGRFTFDESVHDGNDKEWLGDTLRTVGRQRARRPYVVWRPIPKPAATWLPN